jgi:hypothetical protein
MADACIAPALRTWRVVRRLDIAALFVGGVAAAAGQRWGGYLLVANVAAQIGSHIAVGRSAYRRVMARPLATGETP